jgi:hypothetical protein
MGAVIHPFHETMQARAHAHTDFLHHVCFLGETGRAKKIATPRTASLRSCGARAIAAHSRTTREMTGRRGRLKVE